MSGIAVNGNLICHSLPIRNAQGNNAAADRAYNYSKYTFIAAATGASALAFTAGSFFTGFMVVLAAPVATGVSLYHASRVVASRPRNPADLSVVEQKVEKAFRIVLWTGLFAGAISLGFGGTLLFTGAKFLWTGTTTASALGALRTVELFTCATGFMIPFGKRLLMHVNALDDQLKAYAKTFVHQAQQAQPGSIMDAVRAPFLMLLAQLGHQDSTDLTVLGYCSDREIQTYFRQNVFLFDDAKIKTLMERFSNALDYNFLLNSMSPSQINSVIIPQLTQAVTDATSLGAIDRDIEQWNNAIVPLERRYRSGMSDADKAQLYAEINPLLVKMSQHSNVVGNLNMMLKKIVDIRLSANHPCLQLIDRINNNKGTIERLQKTLTDIAPQSIRTRLSALNEKVVPQVANNGMDTEAYEVLGEMGFRADHFNRLAEMMGLSINSLSDIPETMVARGLGTRKDLIDKGILARNAGETLTQELLIERLRNYFNNSVSIAVAPAQAQPSPTLSAGERAARIANYVYHYGTSAALIGIQIAYQPLSTIAGLGSGLASSRTITRSGLNHVWQTLPSYTGQTFEERSRELFWKVCWATSSIIVGPIFGFLSGMQDGYAIRHYARPLTNRAQRWLAQH